MIQEPWHRCCKTEEAENRDGGKSSALGAGCPRGGGIQTCITHRCVLFGICWKAEVGKTGLADVWLMREELHVGRVKPETLLKFQVALGVNSHWIFQLSSCPVSWALQDLPRVPNPLICTARVFLSANLVLYNISDQRHSTVPLQRGVSVSFTKKEQKVMYSLTGKLWHPLPCELGCV